MPILPFLIAGPFEVGPFDLYYADGPVETFPTFAEAERARALAADANIQLGLVLNGRRATQ